MLLRLLCPLALLILSECCHAQDTLYTRSNDKLKVHVKEIWPSKITYTKHGDAGEHLYRISKLEVEKIVYQDGRTEHIDEEGNIATNNTTPTKTSFGNNIASLRFLNIGEEGYGIGLAYEHSFGQHGYVSLYLPVDIITRPLKNYYYSADGNFNLSILQFMPGLRLYPVGNRGRVRLGIGPHFYYQAGSKRIMLLERIPVGPNSFAIKTDWSRFEKYGLMVMAGINITLKKGIYLGLDLGVGKPFSHRLKDVLPRSIDNERLSNTLGQISFKVGYRF